jgi:ferrous iron transport protein B
VELFARLAQPGAGAGLALPARPTAAPGLIPLTLALAGQPNVGKSTVFNALTGLNQHVGNWPGKTVEQKTGRFEHQGRRITLVDLPGTYSLTSGSEEERVARDYLIQQPPAAVIAVVNAATLERNLYLVAELLTLPVPVVVGLNMLDVAEAHGVRVEAPVLAAALGVPVVELVASKGRGLQELIEASIRVVEHPETVRPNRPAIRPKHRDVLDQIEGLLADRSPAGYPSDWLALKLLEGDVDVARLVKGAVPESWETIERLLAQHEDAYLDIAGGRYDWVARMVRAAVVQPRRGAPGLTDRIDRVATHPVWGLLVLIAVLGAMFWITYAVATPAASALSGFVTGDLSPWLRQLLSWAPAWVSGVLIGGVVAGAGTVLSFVPILVVFFAVLGLLEDVGYMARTAYVMDRYMHWMGLHGKSCMPLLLGFGCNVPAVLGTRIIEQRRARLLTMMITPFVPCTGRLAVLAFLAPAFFGAAAAWAVVALVAGNLILLAVVGVAVNKTVFKGERSAFIMEMPLYHRPNIRTIGLYVGRNTMAFIRKAGTLIVLVSAIIWVLSNYPGGAPSQSVLGTIGRALEPFFSLMGLGDWRLIVALLSSFVAKENSVATLGVLFGGGGAAAAGAAGAGLATMVAAVLVPAAAAAFLVVQMTFVPCVATVAAIRQESRSWRWTGANLGLMLAVAMVMGILVYQVGSRIGS